MVGIINLGSFLRFTILQNMKIWCKIHAMIYRIFILGLLQRSVFSSIIEEGAVIKNWFKLKNPCDSLFSEWGKVYTTIVNTVLKLLY